MECGSCGKHINDHSKYCPHCGAEQEAGFCVNCGTAVNTKSSKKGGLVLFMIMVVAVGLLYWSMQSGEQIGKVELKPAAPTQLPTLPQKNLFQRVSDYVFTPETDMEQAEYQVLFSTSIDFGVNKTHEIYLKVQEGENKGKQVKYVQEELAKANFPPQDVVILYTCSDPECRDNGHFLGEFVSLDTSLNPNYKLEADLHALTDKLFLKWYDDAE